jgi:hypothetical protein
MSNKQQKRAYTDTLRSTTYKSCPIYCLVYLRSIYIYLYTYQPYVATYNIQRMLCALSVRSTKVASLPSSPAVHPILHVSPSKQRGLIDLFPFRLRVLFAPDRTSTFLTMLGLKNKIRGAGPHSV